MTMRKRNFESPDGHTSVDWCAEETCECATPKDCPDNVEPDECPHCGRDYDNECPWCGQKAGAWFDRTITDLGFGDMMHYFCSNCHNPVVSPRMLTMRIRALEKENERLEYLYRDSAQELRESDAKVETLKSLLRDCIRG